MELVTGRRPTDFEFNEMEDKKVGAYSLIKLVESRVKLNDINDIVDQALKIEFDSNEEEKKFQELKVGQLMVMGCGDGDRNNSEENSFGREIPKTAEQEFIDVWQVRHRERCLEARERELMTVVEAHLCGLGTTGEEYTWTKSITDGMDLSGNISDTDGQPNDSLFG